jgi:hypothetical protein
MSASRGLARYRVAFEAPEALDLPAHLGSTLRGAFGRAFRRLCHDRHYRARLDAPLPALGGQTPRQAGQTRGGRRRLIALLKDMESHAARERLAGRPWYDFGWMWGELGLARPA